MEKKELKYLLLNLKIDNITDEKLEIILEKYNTRRKNFQSYSQTKMRLAQLIIEGCFPNAKEFNKIAKKEGLYSSKSIKYIEECSWKELENKIIKEIKLILNS